MRLLENNLWIADLDETAASLPELKELAGSRVLVTGCSGLIGSAVMDLMIRWINAVLENGVIR